MGKRAVELGAISEGERIAMIEARKSWIDMDESYFGINHTELL
jgi:hypothetical protein